MLSWIAPEMVTFLFDFYTISYRLTNHATLREDQDQIWLGDRNQKGHEKLWPDTTRGCQADGH